MALVGRCKQNYFFVLDKLVVPAVGRVTGEPVNVGGKTLGNEGSSERRGDLGWGSDIRYGHSIERAKRAVDIPLVDAVGVAGQSFTVLGGDLPELIVRIPYLRSVAAFAFSLLWCS